MVDYKKLEELYRKFFPVHSIFQKDDFTDYLKEQKELFFLEKNNEIVAAAFLVKTYKNEDHSRWKFRHFAWTNENDALELLGILEENVKARSKSAKIELTITENENGLEFYESNGYKIEGELSNHYRMGEKCFVLGKTI